MKNDVAVPKFTYNVKEKHGNGNYVITNRGSDYSIGQITGTASINKENIIKGDFASRELAGNYTINPKETADECKCNRKRLSHSEVWRKFL